MSDFFDEIARQAKKLTAEERAKLAENLLESLQSPISDIEAAWEKEIGERVAAFERGESLTLPAESVFAEARYVSR
jgi:putative addiction module component (TIGR02574 family)